MNDSKKKKLLYTSDNIKISSLSYGKNSVPINLTTSNDKIYNFPKLIDSCLIKKIEHLLISKNKINIMFDNLNRIHKLNDISFRWSNETILFNQTLVAGYENTKYRLIIMSLDKGLIFDNNIRVNAVENVKYFYEDFNIFKFFYHDNEIIIILYEDILIDIPLRY